MTMKNRLFLILVTVLFAAVPGLRAQEKWADVEPIAQSIVRMKSLSRCVVEAIERQVEERGIAGADGREEIAIQTALSLERAICCLERRFFDGADQDEVEERLRLVEALAARVQGSAGRFVLYNTTREKLAALLNEKDWLKSKLGM